MGRFTFVSCLLFTGAVPVIAAETGLDWPVEKDKKYQISSTFGESRLDHFHNGIDLPGEGMKVITPRDGRVLYRIQTEFTPGEMPFGGGNTLIVDHGDQWTGYMHLKTMADAVLQSFKLTAGEKLGTSGNTGHSGGPHLHFFIYDAANRAMLNPLIVMPHTYYADTRPPEAKDWGVLLADKFASVNPDKGFRLTSDYPVYLLLQDHGTGRERWGVYEYKVSIDDKEVMSARFDRILFKDDAWQLGTGQAFEDIFFKNYYSLTTQVRRSKKVGIEAKDIKGNTFAKTYELKIQQN
ncbi:M23 family metallopeptidase [Turneriella parva]|uniref:Peptidase M23 n=1 Tax=Turneriella parva (strain ATCC BAA-1111 / DSM 21527 / NCTC 11395 / H) TaxID=869212 RepID=I4BAU8_TURPD|nr:M23 family metallopeptidase [Turneriella parva]AFM14405.1 Peptidase M23 [Turneriella parva DSM 21527]